MIRQSLQPVSRGEEEVYRYKAEEDQEGESDSTEVQEGTGQEALLVTDKAAAKGKREKTSRRRVKVQSEQERVDKWRREQFAAIFMSHGVAMISARKMGRELAESGARRESIVELLEEGCEPKLIVKILV